MNKFVIGFFLIFILFASACSVKYENETLMFNKYLRETFDREIPVDIHTFLVESTFKCSGCVDKTYKKMSIQVNQNHPNSFTIITCDNNHVPKNLKNLITVLIDKNAKYESLGIPLANITIIETQENRIKSIRSIQLDKIESELQRIFQ